MFSILLSCYKNDSPKYLQDALSSILGQSYLPKQIVIICDGPLPKITNDILKEYSDLFHSSSIETIIHRLRVNRGLGYALSVGVNLCSEDYVVRMDSDDISRPHRLNSLKSILNSDPLVDFVGSYIEEFNTTPGDLNRIRTVPLSNYDIVKGASKFNPMNHVTVCMKKNTVLKDNYCQILWHEDYFLWLKHINQGSIFRNVPDVHVDVRIADLGNRRVGFKYIIAEWKFVYKCFKAKYFTFFNCLTYLSPRFVYRLLPSSVSNFAYSILRSKK